MKYDIDNLDRVTKADEGTLSAGSIGTRKRYEDWTLSHTGQWAVARKDLDGDNNFNETVASVDELDEANTLGSFTYWGKDNSIKARNTNNSGGADVTLTYDKVGQRTADGVGYTYVYDAFGRLRKVYSTGGGTPLVAEYRYNGLNQRIAWHYDVDDGTDTGTPDGVVDADDYWYYWLNNEKWQQVATFRHDTAGSIDTYPKEVFIYHTAGLDGQGGSSYVDSTILRDGDADLFWEPGATTLAERRYYLQNWRADVVGLMTTGAVMLERQKYSAYGQPRWWSPADGWQSGSGSTIDPDGFLTGDDYSEFTAAWASGPAVSRFTDMDADGDEDSTDLSLYDDIFLAGSAVTRGLSLYENRKGFAAYEFEPVIAGPTNQYHVRNRVLDSDTGQWTKRDPLEYVDGSSFYEYSRTSPVVRGDPYGTQSQPQPQYVPFASVSGCSGCPCNIISIGACSLNVQFHTVPAPVTGTIVLCVPLWHWKPWPARLVNPPALTFPPPPCGLGTVPRTFVITTDPCLAFRSLSLTDRVGLLKLSYCASLRATLASTGDADCNAVATGCTCVPTGGPWTETQISGALVGATVMVGTCPVSVWANYTYTRFSDPGICVPSLRLTPVPGALQPSVPPANPYDLRPGSAPPAPSPKPPADPYDLRPGSP